MTDEQKATLHHILLDAKAEIKDGELYDHDGNKSHGICVYVAFHTLNSYDIDELCTFLYKSSPFYKNELFIAKPYDFAHPDRLALLDWLINETKP